MLNYDGFSAEERAILELSDKDNQSMIAAYVEGQPFTQDFIRSLNLEDSKKTCKEYNERVSDLKYCQERIKSFTDYINTIKGWY